MNCPREAADCSLCGARPNEDCPQASLTEGLSPFPQPATVTGGDCSGEDGVCESCQ